MPAHIKTLNRRHYLYIEMEHRFHKSICISEIMHLYLGKQLCMLWLIYLVSPVVRLAHLEWADSSLPVYSLRLSVTFDCLLKTQLIQ